MTTTKSTHPRGLFTASIANAGNMVGLAMINALVVLYCTRQLNIPVKESYELYAAFESLFYSASLFGGYIGGRFDYVLSIIIGSSLAGAGSFLLASADISTLYFGLAAFVVGSGLVTANVYCIIGKLYGKEDGRRDGGFTIAYMLTNIGGAAAALSSGFIATYWGFHTAFFISASIITGSLLLFVATYKRFDYYHDERLKPYKPNLGWKNAFPIIISIVIAIPVIRTLLNHAEFSNYLLMALGVCMIFVVIKLALNQQGAARKKMFLFLIFILIGTVFWALYMLAPSALTIFIQNNVDRTVGNFKIPTSTFYGLNPVFIISFGFLTSYFFLWLAKHKKTLALPWKFSIGILFMGLGYVVLFVGIFFAGKDGLTAMIWVILSYMLQSFGELFIGPVGYAMVGSLCPVKLEGLMTGVFRFSSGVAGAVSGFLAAATAAPKAIAHQPLLSNHIFARSFGIYGIITIGVAIIVMLFVPKFKKLWAH